MVLLHQVQWERVIVERKRQRIYFARAQQRGGMGCVSVSGAVPCVIVQRVSNFLH